MLLDLKTEYWENKRDDEKLGLKEDIIEPTGSYHDYWESQPAGDKLWNKDETITFGDDTTVSYKRVSRRSVDESGY
ncbi:MAG: hypothetical protein LBT46_04175 [Planctomycetaceae bacterium]|jgi:TRAP-type mannitol/chloroaromatic compound transport system substrate-binding protein|nr:hypothetical protein [Planctomycetaceae bacterium]